MARYRKRRGYKTRTRGRKGRTRSRRSKYYQVSRGGIRL